MQHYFNSFLRLLLANILAIYFNLYFIFYQCNLICLLDQFHQVTVLN